MGEEYGRLLVVWDRGLGNWVGNLDMPDDDDCL